MNFSIPQLSALALDPSGARLVTGGYDYDIKFWDFAGMDSSLQSFRNIRPCEGLGFHVVSIVFQPYKMGVNVCDCE